MSTHPAPAIPAVVAVPQQPIGYVTTMAWPETGTVFNTSRVVSKETAEACAKQWRSQSREYKVEVISVYAAPQPAAAPSGDVAQYDDSKKDAERLIFAMQDIDGFGGVAWDKYDYAMHFAHCNGRDEPTKEDELIGVRALIDAAITATKE